MEDQEFLEKLGQRIAQLRKQKGWTQVEFAEKLGIHRTALTRIETGGTNLTVLTLRLICKNLDLEMNQFFDKNLPI
jgi:transcriptional regulator with XRE-family HTH domain